MPTEKEPRMSIDLSPAWRHADHVQIQPADLTAAYTAAAQIIRDRGYSKHGNHDYYEAGSREPVSLASAIMLACQSLRPDDSDYRDTAEERLSVLAILAGWHRPRWSAADEVTWWDDAQGPEAWRDGELWNAPGRDTALALLDAAAAIMTAFIPQPENAPADA